VIDPRAIRRLVRVGLAALTSWLAVAPALGADDSTDAWDALVAGGHVALIRHGNAPGPSLGQGGDPPGFRIDDCMTQRNLDEAGRAESKALGEAFRARGVRVARVLSSPWCRCQETARLMAVGPVEVSWALVPPTERNPNAPAALRALKDMVSAWGGPDTLVLVTHGLTVKALVGIVPGQAETVVLKPTPGREPGAQVVGRIAVPP
jgi:phosphohistidine phosphatase SixA